MRTPRKEAGHVARSAAGGRPPKDPDLVAEGVRLVQQGTWTPEEAAEEITLEQLKKLGKKSTPMEKRRVTISGRTIRRALPPGGPSAPPAPPVRGAAQKRRGCRSRAKAQGVQEQRRPAAAPPLERLRGYAAHDPEALSLLDDLYAEDAPEMLPLDRVRKLIPIVERRALNAPANRFAPLGGLLDRLYARERQLMGPPPPAPDAVNEILRIRDLEAIAKIEEHLPDRITPEELRA